MRGIAVSQVSLRTSTVPSRLIGLVPSAGDGGHLVLFPSSSKVFCRSSISAYQRLRAGTRGRPG
jgi:hypothetical protein